MNVWRVLQGWLAVMVLLVGLGVPALVAAQATPEQLIFGPQQYLRTTGAPNEYVRVISRLLPEKRNRGFLSSFRSAVLSLEPEVRHHVISAVTATLCAGTHILALAIYCCPTWVASW